MVDFPDQPGKMCDWPKVEVVQGARECLHQLSDQAKLYVATGAAESTEAEIKQVFERVDLAQYISGYFCKANLGISKGHENFLPEILARLKVSATQVAMVGDSYERDIKPALAAGLAPIWLNPNNESSHPRVKIIKSLCELTK